jgi:hypothetical protein
MLGVSGVGFVARAGWCLVLRERKVVVVGGGVMLAVASPLAFALGSAELGDAVSASIIAATAVAALAVPLWPGRGGDPEPGDAASGGGLAVGTGPARAVDGGDANSGVRRRRGAGGAVRAERTGTAVARGAGSRANSGVEEVD